MKKSLLMLFAGLALLSFAQSPHNHNIDGKCSHQHRFEDSFKNTADISLVSDKYHMNFLHLNLTVESTSTFVEGSSRMDAIVLSPTLDTIYLELNQTLTLDSMTFNGQLVEPVFQNSELFLIVDEMMEGDAFSLITYYHGAASSGGFFSGITSDYNSSYGKSVTWTLSEPFSARDWFPVRQSLEDKIDSVYQYYTCIDTEMVGSNGLLTDVVDNGNGTKTYKWETRYPISFYLLSFSVSDYQEYNIYAKPAQLNGDSVLIQNFIYDHPNCLPNNVNNINRSSDMLELLSEKWGLYPFHEEKYGNCLAEIGGGMEHQTMTTIGGFNFDLNIHEMGHMWYGDNITCATWSDIWINEGFASYSEYVGNQYLNNQSVANSWMSGVHNYVTSSPGGSVYVPEDQIFYGNEWRIFDGRLTYDKGAAILHQLRYLINNDTLFFGAMENYTQEYANSVATGMDYKNSMEAYTGMDFDSYFDQWYFGEGYPTYSVEYSYNDVGLYFTITQTTSMPLITPHFDLPVEILVNFGGGADSTFRVNITGNITHVQTEITNPIILLQVDPSNWIINKVGSIFVGTSELRNELGVVIGPNPANNELQIVFEKESGSLKEIVAYDLAGRQVGAWKTYGNTVIDITELTNGYYSFKVTDGTAVVTRKILKN